MIASDQQHLNINSSIILVSIIILLLTILTFFYFDLPHPKEFHFQELVFLGIAVLVLDGIYIHPSLTQKK